MHTTFKDVDCLEDSHVNGDWTRTIVYTNGCCSCYISLYQSNFLLSVSEVLVPPGQCCMPLH